MGLFKWRDRLHKYTDEEIEEKRKKLNGMEWDKSDEFAIFIAAITTFGPPLIIIFIILYLIIRLFY